MRTFSRCLIVSLLLAAFSGGGAYAQSGTSGSPFVLDPVGDSLLAGSGVLLVGGSLWLDTLKPAPDLTGLNPAEIPPFDRLYATTYSKPLSFVSDGLLFATLALPVAFAPGLSVNNLVTLGTMYAETLAIAYGYKETVKALVVRYRPYAYSTDTAPALLHSAEVEDSMPSGHTTAAFASAVFAGYTFSLLYPASPWQPAVWGAGLGLASVTAALRVMSGNHFLSDVLAGAAGGALVGFVVPYLHTGAGVFWSGATPVVRTAADPAAVAYSLSAIVGTAALGAAAILLPGITARAHAALEPFAPRVAFDPVADRVDVSWSIAR